MKDSRVIGALTILYLLLLLPLGWQIRHRLWRGEDDFAQFYAGARLIGTPGLYNAGEGSNVQRRAVGATSDYWRYVRPPYYAALLWPLGKLPYRAARLAWALLGLCAWALFVRLWKGPSAAVVLLFSCLSLPLLAGLINGQDVAFLLLWVALAMALWRRGRAVAAGAVLSLCAAKFHLFALVPVWLAAQKQWRFLWGLLCGGAALAALSVAAAGPSWPREYYAALVAPNMNPEAIRMPNLQGLFSLWPSAWPLLWLCAAAVVAAVWLIARRAAFEYALAATLAGGLLLSYHSYLADCSLLLPAALTVLYTTVSAWLRFLALFLLLPFAYFLLLFPSPLPVLVPLTILLFIFLMALEAWRHSGELPEMREQGGPAGGLVGLL